MDILITSVSISLLRPGEVFYSYNRGDRILNTIEFKFKISIQGPAQEIEVLPV